MSTPEKFIIDSSSLAHEDHHDDLHAYHKETWMHLVAREGRVILRVIIICSLVGVLLTFWSPFLFLPLIPLSVLLGSYILLVIANEIEYRAAKITGIQDHDAAAHIGEVVTEDVNDEPEHAANQRRRDLRIIRRESTIGTIILICLIVAAVIMARVVIPAEAMLIGGFFVFAYMLLLGAPLWLGWIQNDIDEQSHEIPEQH